MFEKILNVKKSFKFLKFKFINKIIYYKRSHNPPWLRIKKRSESLWRKIKQNKDNIKSLIYELYDINYIRNNLIFSCNYRKSKFLNGLKRGWDYGIFYD